MINSKPNNKKYDQGNFIPKNKDKVIILNKDGGVYYRSSWEKKIMTWLDGYEKVEKWGAECIKIPYQQTHMVDGDPRIKNHTYYPDFYYELRDTNNILTKVVVEVKPHKEYEDAMMLESNQFKIDEKKTMKQLANVEYRIKMAQKNTIKWKTMIKWCEMKGYEFIIITENHLKNM